jgi:hypothetical protein
MSATPLTDASKVWMTSPTHCGTDDGWYVRVHDAESIEEQLTQAKSGLAAAKSSLDAANQREAGLREALASARTQLMAHGHAENCISCALSVIDAAIRSAATGGVEK